MPRGTRQLPKECLRRLGEAELILHGGDVVGRTVLDALRELAPVEAVAGNMDDAELMAMLPVRRVVEVADARIGMVHVPGPAAGRAERLVESFPGCDAVVYGHTHVPEVTRVGETWVLNPGSPTERRSSPTRSMLMLEIESGAIRPEFVPLSS
jgi:putative phosphoesterase